MTSRWSAAGGISGDDYAARFAALAATGADVHGEAAFVTTLIAPGARVLDAGCGTGRVAVRLAELGYACTGVDSDDSMLATARRSSRDVHWLLGDLADLADPEVLEHPSFDLVVCAGNVIPFLAAGSEPAVVAALAARLSPDGLLATGFGLDRRHLPPAAALVRLADYDDWCAAAGLDLIERYATWDRDPYVTDPPPGYAVSVHRRR
ncbi:MAG: class I SAM-dependent methyltransferase [Actinobacteria bacterium]|nr:class I SAM-dependent methyltransferase [Actinomycetota bacterium]